MRMTLWLARASIEEKGIISQVQSSVRFGRILTV